MTQNQTSSGDRSGMVIGAFIMIGLGTLFLLINFGILPDWGDIWPAILIIVGIALLIGSFLKKNDKDKTELN